MIQAIDIRDTVQLKSEDRKDSSGRRILIIKTSTQIMNLDLNRKLTVRKKKRKANSFMM